MVGITTNHNKLLLYTCTYWDNPLLASPHCVCLSTERYIGEFVIISSRGGQEQPPVTEFPSLESVYPRQLLWSICFYRLVKVTDISVQGIALVAIEYRQGASERFTPFPSITDCPLPRTDKSIAGCILPKLRHVHVCARPGMGESREPIRGTDPAGPRRYTPPLLLSRHNERAFSS